MNWSEFYEQDRKMRRKKEPIPAREITIRLTLTEIAKLDARAHYAKTTRSALVRSYIQKGLKEMEKKP